MFSKSFATVMVWFTAILAGTVIFSTGISEEGHLCAFGWGVFMTFIILLMGRFALWMFWEREEQEGKG